MRHSVPHDLSVSDARALVHEALDAYVARFDAYAPSVIWPSADRVEVEFVAKGLRLTGSIDIAPTAFVLQMEVPLLLRPLRPLAITRIDAEAARLIAAFEASRTAD